jgi:hypothetical protein
MHFILMTLINLSNPVTYQEFDSKESCETAKNIITKSFLERKSQLLGGETIIVECIKK